MRSLHTLTRPVPGFERIKAWLEWVKENGGEMEPVSASSLGFLLQRKKKWVVTGGRNGRNSSVLC